MKKLTYLLLALVLILSLAACGGETTKKPAETGKTEENKEGTKEGEKPAVAETKAGTIAKLGLGSVTSLEKSKDLAEGKGQAQADTTVVAVAVDADGKIVDVKIDVAQSKAPINDDGTLGFDPMATKLETKRDLGDKYGMKDASAKTGIGKEWYEQADALQQAWIGKTIEEALGMKKDAEKDTLPDLASSVTIKVSGYMAALKKASENLVPAEGAEKIGLGIETSFGAKGTVPAADGKGAKVQFNSNINATAVDKDGKIVATLIDVAQNSVEFTPEGKLSADYAAAETTSKKEKGAEYGMIKASTIKKEWFEQAKALEEYLVGKDAEGVKGIKTEKRDDAHLAVPAEEPLKASVSVTIDGYQAVILEAMENAK